MSLFSLGTNFVYNNPRLVLITLTIVVTCGTVIYLSIAASGATTASLAVMKAGGTSAIGTIQGSSMGTGQQFNYMEVFDIVRKRIKVLDDIEVNSKNCLSLALSQIDEDAHIAAIQKSVASFKFPPRDEL